uniref:Transmembrane protein n=1 Tax=Steinernema glaseri TaxID=37863 RepID=A0A1I7YV81_9BILA
MRKPLSECTQGHAMLLPTADMDMRSGLQRSLGIRDIADELLWDSFDFLEQMLIVVFQKVVLPECLYVLFSDPVILMDALIGRCPSMHPIVSFIVSFNCILLLLSYYCTNSFVAQEDSFWAREVDKISVTLYTTKQEQETLRPVLRGEGPRAPGSLPGAWLTYLAIVRFLMMRIRTPPLRGGGGLTEKQRAARQRLEERKARMAKKTVDHGPTEPEVVSTPMEIVEEDAVTTMDTEQEEMAPPQVEEVVMVEPIAPADPLITPFFAPCEDYHVATATDSWQSETPGEIVHTMGHDEWLSDSAILRFLMQRLKRMNNVPNLR